MVALRFLLIRISLFTNAMTLLYLCTVRISTSSSREESHILQHSRALESFVEQPTLKSPLDPPPDSLEKTLYPDFRGCDTRAQVPLQSQRGEYWLLENYVPADLTFRCDETITYTTHGDYTFLDNLETLTSRWQVRI